MLGLASWDDTAGRFSIDTLASSDAGVLGLRGLWNVTNPPSAEPLTSDLAKDSLSQSQSPLSTVSSSTPTETTSSPDRERINGRFSAGGEIYYGTLNKSGGLSFGGRFQTLPTHHGTPLTATLTFNLLGHVSATYAVVAGPWTLASQFGFNLYSYESDWALGMELWNKKRRVPSPAVAEVERLGQEQASGGLVTAGTATATATAALDAPTSIEINMDGDASVSPPESSSFSSSPTTPSIPTTATKTYKERSFQAKMEWRLDHEIDLTIPTATSGTGLDQDTKRASAARPEDEFPGGVLRCRCDQNMRIGLMYEGRYKSLLFSLGSDVDLHKLDAPFRGVGLAVQFSS